MNTKRKVIAPVVATAIIMALSLYGCKDAASLLDFDRVPPLSVSLSPTEALEMVAKPFATMVFENPAIQSRLVALCLSELSGMGTEVLYEHVKAESVESASGETTIDEAFSDAFHYHETGHSFESVIEHIPYFEIYYHVPPQQKSDQLLVTSIDYTRSEQEIDYVIAYAENGIVVALDAKNEPESPVFVLGMSETLRLRDYISATSRAEPKTLSGLSLKWTQTSVSGDGNLSYLESWLRGNLEMYLNIMYKSGETTIALIQRQAVYPRSSFPGWYDHADGSLIYYDLGVYGTPIGATAVEWDGNSGDAYTWSFSGFSLASTAFAVDFNDNDEDCGGAPINATDSSPLTLGFSHGVEMEVQGN